MTRTWIATSSRAGLRRLREIAAPAKRAFIKPVERAEKDHATHVPILVGLASLSKIERVLELGCGEFSTLTFLNRLVYPDLICLRTIDHDQAWLDRVLNLSHRDSRLQTTLVKGEISNAIAGLRLEDFDLVFIDDSMTADQRVRTISEIGSRSIEAPTVIHDFEVQVYRQAANAWHHQYVFKSLNPETAVVWNGSSTRNRPLRQVDKIVKRFSKQIAPDDVAGWANVFANK